MSASAPASASARPSPVSTSTPRERAISRTWLPCSRARRTTCRPRVPVAPATARVSAGAVSVMASQLEDARGAAAEQPLGHREGAQVDLEVHVQPAGRARTALLDRAMHQLAADPGALPVGAHRSVDEERVAPAVGDDVAEAHQLPAAAGGDPAQGVALEPLAPGLVLDRVIEGGGMEHRHLGVVDLLAPGELRLLPRIHLFSVPPGSPRVDPKRPIFPVWRAEEVSRR